jgi:hypothetical protein
LVTYTRAETASNGNSGPPSCVIIPPGVVDDGEGDEDDEDDEGDDVGDGPPDDAFEGETSSVPVQAIARVPATSADGTQGAICLVDMELLLQRTTEPPLVHSIGNLCF